MKPELEAKLVADYPGWFDVHGNIQHTVMPFGFEHGDGWFDILERLCRDIKPLLAPMEAAPPFEGWRFEVLQVKEKFGGLRFYTSSASKEVFERIHQAEKESGETCEECGKPGETMHRGTWLKTVCSGCAEELGYVPFKCDPADVMDELAG